MAPFFTTLGPVQFILLNIAIGIAFGFILERAGFGNAKRLAAQFYFTNQSVLKVMFTAIITAMVLIHWTGAVGLLDLDRIELHETYLWPAIIGGLLLGVGFIIGGYCPGTSIVAAATLKIDGIVFVLGCLAGIFVFGQTIEWHQTFWLTAGYAGKLTLPQWLGLREGVVVLGVVVMALGMFWGAEKLEQLMGGGERSATPSVTPATCRESLDGVADPTQTRTTGILPVALADAAEQTRAGCPWYGSGGRVKLVGAGAITLLGAMLAIFTQIVPDWRAERLQKQIRQDIAARVRHIDSGELLSLMHNNQIKLVLLDVREEADFNQFHLIDARRVETKDLNTWVRDLPPNAIKVLMSNDEHRAEKAYKHLALRGDRGVYILEGGINRWLTTYARATGLADAPCSDDELRFEFPVALGSRLAYANPDPQKVPRRPFTPKVQFDSALPKPAAGCGG